MTDRKISDLNNITGANLADADEFVVVDTSADETKAITFSELKEAFDTSTDFVRITGDTMTGDLTVPNVVVSGTVDGRDVSADGTKLDGIEVGADVTDTANVTAAGALMDSEITNLAQVKAFDSADYATATQGTLADSATQPGDNISTLTNDAGYTNNVGDITGVTAGSGITGGGTSGTVTVSHADTSAQSSVNNSGATFIQDVTVDTYGHITGLGSATITPATIGALSTSGKAADSNLLDGLDSTAFYLASNPNGYTSNVGDITGVTAGAGLSGGGTSGTPTLSHADTSSQGSVNNSGTTVIQDVTLDTYGHVTSIGSTTLTIPSAGAGAVEAWVNFNGTGSVSIRADGNVSSITDHGTGQYSTNFSSSLSDANYAVTSMTRWISGSTFNLCHIESGTIPSTSTFRVRTMNNAGTSTDSFIVGMQVAR